MRPFTALAALALPGIVIGLGLSRLGAPVPQPEHPSRARHDSMMTTDPDVVLLGASKLATDLNRDALAKALGVAPKEVVSLGLSGTSSPVWYTVLNNRVVRAGKKPKLIVIYSTLDWVLSTDLSRPGRAVIDAHRGEAEPVLQEKVFRTGARSPFWERVESTRGSLREAWLATIRDTAVGSVFGAGAAPAAEEGKAISGPALEHLFGLGAAVIEGGGHRAIPVVETAKHDYEVRAESIEDTLVPDLVAIAKEAGAHIVFVRAPVRPESEVLRGGPPELEAAMIAYLNEAGGGYIDLRDLNLPSSAFGDASHVGVVGRPKVTAELAARLIALGALTDGQLAEAEVTAMHAPPKVTRSGTFAAVSAGAEPKPGKGPCDQVLLLPPELMRLTDDVLGSSGVGPVSPLVLFEDGAPLQMHTPVAQLKEACAGKAVAHQKAMRFTPTKAGEHTWTIGVTDAVPILTEVAAPAYWVYPGAGLDFAWPEPWAPGARTVRVALWTPQPKGTPSVRIGDTSVPLTRTGAYWSVEAPVPDGIDTVSVEAATFAYVQMLSLGNEADRRFAVGSASPVTVPLTRGVATYAGAAPSWPTPTPEADGAMASWDLAPTGVPDTLAMRKRASVANCSPFVVVEDGVLLPNQVDSRKWVEEKGAGHYALQGTKLLAVASDGSNPATNGRSYEVKLLEDRKCRGMRWMYPGDKVTVTWKGDDYAALPADPTHLELAGGSVAGPESEAVVEVVARAGGVELLRTSMFLRDFPTNVPLLRFPSPVRRDAPVEVDLTLGPDSPWLLLTAISLRLDPDAKDPAASAPAP